MLVGKGVAEVGPRRNVNISESWKAEPADFLLVMINVKVINSPVIVRLSPALHLLLQDRVAASRAKGSAYILSFNP